MPTSEILIVENKKNGGNIAPNSFVAPNSKVEYPINVMHNVTIYGNTKIGKYTYINVNSVIYSKVIIGKYCSIGRNVEIGCAFHPIDWLSTSPLLFDKKIFKNKEYISFPKEKWEGHQDTIIGNDVWIGAGVKINSGIQIGDGVIIGSGAIVTKDIEPYSIIGGVPAKIIKKRFKTEEIEELLKIKWWELDLKEIEKIEFTNISKSIKQLKKIKKEYK